MVVEDLKDEIDDVAEAVKDSLPEKAKKIRDSVVKEVTGKKLASQFHVLLHVCAHILKDLIQFFQSKPHTSG